MNLENFLGAKWIRRVSALSMLAKAAVAIYRGNRRTAVLLIGASLLAYRFSGVGIAAEMAIRLYQFQR